MKPNLTVALSEFSKGRWAAEPSGEPPLHPTELNLVARVWSRLGKLDPLAFARYLIAFFIGVTATLAWQSNRGAPKEEMIVAAPASLDSVRQSVDKLAVEIAKVQEGRPNLIDFMKNGEIALVINTPSGQGGRTDEGRIRAAAVAHGVTGITTLAAAQAGPIDRSLPIERTTTSPELSPTRICTASRPSCAAASSIARAAKQARTA